MKAMPVLDFIAYRADIIVVMEEKAAAQEKAMRNAKKNMSHMKGIKIKKR